MNGNVIPYNAIIVNHYIGMDQTIIANHHVISNEYVGLNDGM